MFRGGGSCVHRWGLRGAQYFAECVRVQTVIFVSLRRKSGGGVVLGVVPVYGIYVSKKNLWDLSTSECFLWQIFFLNILYFKTFYI